MMGLVCWVEGWNLAMALLGSVWGTDKDVYVASLVASSVASLWDA